MVFEWYFNGSLVVCVNIHLNGTSMVLGVLWPKVSEWYFNGTLVVSVTKQLNGI